MAAYPDLRVRKSPSVLHPLIDTYVRAHPVRVGPLTFNLIAHLRYWPLDEAPLGRWPTVVLLGQGFLPSEFGRLVFARERTSWQVAIYDPVQSSIFPGLIAYLLDERLATAFHRPRVRSK